MDGSYGNKDDFSDLYPPRPASAGCLNNWSPLDSPSGSSSSHLFGSSSGEKLEHLVKSRPRKPKSRAPTRVSIVSTSSLSTSYHDDYPGNCGRVRRGSGGPSPSSVIVSDRIDDGLDLFFRKPIVLKSGSKQNDAPQRNIVKQQQQLLLQQSQPQHQTQHQIQHQTQQQQQQQQQQKAACIKLLSSNNNIEKLPEKSITSSSKSPTKAIQKIIKSFEIRVNRESVK